MAYTLSTLFVLGSSQTGLTLTAALFDSLGDAAAGLTTTTFEEIGATGTYLWTGTIPDGHRGYLKASSGATYKAAIPINPQTAEYLDAKVSSVTVGLSMAVAEAAGVAVGSDLSAVRGDTWSLAINGLGNISSRTKLWFAIKDDRAKADSLALVQIEEAAGLIYLNAGAGTANQGSITVGSATLGNITVGVAAVATAQIAPGTHYRWDVQMLAGSTVTTLGSGKFEVTADVNRATS